MTSRRTPLMQARRLAGANAHARSALPNRQLGTNTGRRARRMPVLGARHSAPAVSSSATGHPTAPYCAADTTQARHSVPCHSCLSCLTWRPGVLVPAPLGRAKRPNNGMRAGAGSMPANLGGTPEATPPAPPVLVRGLSGLSGPQRLSASAQRMSAQMRAEACHELSPTMGTTSGVGSCPGIRGCRCTNCARALVRCASGVQLCSSADAGGGGAPLPVGPLVGGRTVASCTQVRRVARTSNRRTGERWRRRPARTDVQTFRRTDVRSAGSCVACAYDDGVYTGHTPATGGSDSATLAGAR